MSTMPRWRSMLRQFAPAAYLHVYCRRLPLVNTINVRLFYTSPWLIQRPPFVAHSVGTCSKLTPFSNSHSVPRIYQSLLPLTQVRHITAKQKKRKLKSRSPMTPVTSKVKKIKIKGYSSFKGRFKILNDGQIRRWKAGKRHNAHSKSKKSKSRLRQPGIVHLAYAKVMKKLNFCG